MGTYFLDSSAIVKRYVSEQGQVWIRILCNPANGHKLYISQAALVEVVATMCKKAREQSITIADRDRLINMFRQDCRKVYGIRLVNTAMYTYAADLCRLHQLRAYDAIQLACVLRLRDDALANQAPAPIFVCADINLINIATAEGFSAENPNNYSDASQG
jgi:predicted nucleic acid-binding protein